MQGRFVIPRKKKSTKVTLKEEIKTDLVERVTAYLKAHPRATRVLLHPRDYSNYQNVKSEISKLTKLPIEFIGVPLKISPTTRRSYEIKTNYLDRLWSLIVTDEELVEWVKNYFKFNPGCKCIPLHLNDRTQYARNKKVISDIIGEVPVRFFEEPLLTRKRALLFKVDF